LAALTKYCARAKRISCARAYHFFISCARAHLCALALNLIFKTIQKYFWQANIKLVQLQLFLSHFSTVNHVIDLKNIVLMVFIVFIDIT
jgi:hypothetical protein